MLWGAVICVLHRKVIRFSIWQGSYPVVLLVLLLVSLTIYRPEWALFCCSFFFLQLCTYTTFKYLVRTLFHMDKLHVVRECYNICYGLIVERATHAQTVDTRPFLSSHAEANITTNVNAWIKPTFWWSNNMLYHCYVQVFSPGNQTRSFMYVR